MDRNLGKTNPLNENDLADFLANYPKKALTENSWIVDLKDVDSETLDLSVKNPNKKDETVYRAPAEILAEMADLDKQTAKLLKEVQELVK